MIGRIAGKLLAKKPPLLLIDVAGVGYEVEVPMSTFYKLPDLNAEVALVTHLSIKEDAHLLYGFATEEERIAFRELLRVSGIGARTALGVLSGLSVADLGQAIAAQDTTKLCAIPGIGKKTAERVLIDLKTRFAKALPATAVATDLFDTGERADILNALQALGYSEKDSAAAVAKLPAGVSVQDGIKLALKQITG